MTLLNGFCIAGTDPEATIIGAFQMFDKTDCGKISEEQLLKILKNKRGDPLSDADIEAMYKGKPPISGGKRERKRRHFNYLTSQSKKILKLNLNRVLKYFLDVFDDFLITSVWKICFCNGFKFKLAHLSVA